MSDLFWRHSRTHHASDGKSKAPKVPTSQNTIFLSAISMNSTCRVRQGEKEKPEVRCFTFHVNRKNSRVSSEKSNLPDTQVKTDATCLQGSTLAGCEERTPACTHTLNFSGKHQSYFTPLSIIFHFFKRYLYISLSLPIVTLAHSSLTMMYQENILCEKAGLDVILYFCSYHEKKRISWAVFPSFKFAQCMGIPI